MHAAGTSFKGLECQVEELEMLPKGNGKPWRVCDPVQGRWTMRSLSQGLGVRKEVERWLGSPGGS